MIHHAMPYLQVWADADRYIEGAEAEEELTAFDAGKTLYRILHLWACSYQKWVARIVRSSQMPLHQVSNKETYKIGYLGVWSIKEGEIILREVEKQR